MTDSHASNQKRTKQVVIRMTDDEHCRLMDKKTNARLATWVREFCLERPTKKNKRVKIADPNLLAQLARIGGNLNQIAKQANTVGSDFEKIRAFGLLTEIQSQLDELLVRHSDDS